MKYFLSIAKKGLEFIKSGKIIDCINHALDMIYVFICYGNQDERKTQRKLLNKSLRYAYTNCNYYKDIAKTIDCKDNIENYPFLTKKIIRENFNEIASLKKDRMIFNVAHTGGSTGQPLEFLNSNGLDDFFWKKLWERNGYKSGDVILSMMGIKLEEEKVNNNIYWKETKWSETSYGLYQLSSLYLDNKNINYYYDFLCNTKPAFIRGYPSFIYEIAKYIVDNNLDINFKVKTIAVTSESSFEYQWETIKKAFKCKIVLQYGHTECCVFAYSFDQSMVLRCEPLYGYVEIIGKDNKHVRKGEIGEVVVTSLHNNVMPLIRYKTGDLAIYDGEDEKGIYIKNIMGRTQDYIIDKNNQKKLLTALIFAQHFDAMGKIDKWQIEQNIPGEIIVRIIKSNLYTKKDEIELISLFNNLGNCDCKIEYVDSLKKTQRGKSVMLIQNIN